MTEWISGVNIPSCQLLIGMGIPLHRIPDIRRMYGRDLKGSDTIDFEQDQQIPASGGLHLSILSFLLFYNHISGYSLLSTASQASGACAGATPRARTPYLQAGAADPCLGTPLPRS